MTYLTYALWLLYIASIVWIFVKACRSDAACRDTLTAGDLFDNLLEGLICLPVVAIGLIVTLIEYMPGMDVVVWRRKR